MREFFDTKRGSGYAGDMPTQNQNSQVPASIAVQKIQKKELPQSEIEITGEISAEIFETFRKHAVKNLSESLTLDGFRAGHIPESIILNEVGEMGILEEMAELALAKHYPQILTEGTDGEKIDAIGRPEITLTALAAGNPLGFTIKTAVFPALSFPDYEKIAHEQNAKNTDLQGLVVEESEVEKALAEIQKAREEDERDGDKNKNPEKPAAGILDDAFAQSVGDFKTVGELKEKIRENLLQEKTRRAKSKRRAEILDAIAAHTKGDIPHILRDNELRTMLEQFKTDIASLGAKFEDYLREAKKSEEEILKEWAPDAEKRIRINLALAHIAKEKKFSADEEVLERETAHLLEHYQDADPARVRAYLQTSLANEKVLEFLEKI